MRLDSDTELEVSELDDNHVRLHLHHGSLALRLRSSESAVRGKTKLYDRATRAIIELDRTFWVRLTPSDQLAVGECQVAPLVPDLRRLVLEDRDPDVVLGVGLDVFRRYAGGVTGELADEVTQMVRGQAAKRVAFQFVERRRSSWDHRKLGGTY